MPPFAAKWGKNGIIRAAFTQNSGKDERGKEIEQNQKNRKADRGIRSENGSRAYAETRASARRAVLKRDVISPCAFSPLPLRGKKRART